MKYWADRLLPPEVEAAFQELRRVAEKHGVSLDTVTGCAPATALMWKMSDEVQRLRAAQEHEDFSDLV